MPWMPELFSAPVLERVLRQSADARAAAPVSYFAGVTAGETEALLGSFAGEAEVHHPVRGRVKGRTAFERFVRYSNGWLAERHAVLGPVERIVTSRRGVEETALTLDGEHGRVELPVAIAADRDGDGRIIEVRVYYGSWPLTGRNTTRPPLLQPDPGLEAPDVVGEYLSALAAGDVDAVVAAFEPDAYVREPAGGPYFHRGHEALVALYARLFFNRDGIGLEQCSVTDDGRRCALEYNVVHRGYSELAPQAGIAVFVRGASGKLASVRVYDDADPEFSNRD